MLVTDYIWEMLVFDSGSFVILSHLRILAIYV